MLIASRNSFAVKPKWKNPYVTDGLLAMWDGEWNAGGGTHSDAITNWYDLTGNSHAFHAPSPVWQNNHAKYIADSNSLFRATAAEAGWLRDLLATGTYSVEFVACPAPNRTDANFFMCWNEGSGFSTKGFITNVNRTGLRFKAQASSNYDLSVEGVTSTSVRYMAVSVNGQTGKIFVNSSSLNISSVPQFTVGNYGYAFGYRADLYNLNSRLTWIDGINLYRLSVYSRALSQEEISANYAVDKIRFNL